MTREGMSGYLWRVAQQVLPTRKYKYAIKFVDLPDCPPSTCIPATGQAFRFCFDPLRSESFQPTADEDNPDAGCSEWGLSMYTSEAKARKRFERLTSRYPGIRERIGTHLARGSLHTSHGMMSKPHKTGHFNLHEFAGTDLVPAFEIIGPLP